MVSIHQRFLRQLKRALFGPPLSRGLARICFPVDEHSLSATEIDPENAIEVLVYEEGRHNWRDGLYLPSPYTPVALKQTIGLLINILQKCQGVPQSVGREFESLPLRQTNYNKPID